MGNGLGFAKVAVTCRAGDEAKLLAQVRQASQQNQQHDVAQQKVFALPALEGPLAALNSTEIRKALKVLVGAMEPSSVQTILYALAAQQ